MIIIIKIIIVKIINNYYNNDFNDIKVTQSIGKKLPLAHPDAVAHGVAPELVDGHLERLVCLDDDGWVLGRGRIVLGG